VTSPTPATDAADGGFVPYIAHDEFRRGLPHGHFRLVVNPSLARPYVVQRTRINVFAITAIGIGAVLALSGQALPGAVLVVLGIGANRLVRHQAGRIVAHLALKDSAVYAEVTSNGVMEVRRARDAQ
jgi:hypothetical protein